MEIQFNCKIALKGSRKDEDKVFSNVHALLMMIPIDKYSADSNEEVNIAQIVFRYFAFDSELDLWFSG